MTIEELYKWAIKHDCEKASLIIVYWDAKWGERRLTAPDSEPYYDEDENRVII